MSKSPSNTRKYPSSTNKSTPLQTDEACYKRLVTGFLVNNEIAGNV